MKSDDGAAVRSAVGHLESLITALPPDARRDKALYQLERLRMAFESSHQEAVRFAAFTVNKIVHDAVQHDRHADSDAEAGVTRSTDALLQGLVRQLLYQERQLTMRGVERSHG